MIKSLWATYDLTSFSLCEHFFFKQTSFATKVLKYHTDGPWSGSAFMHCLEFSVIYSMFFCFHISIPSIPEGLEKKLSNYSSFLFLFHPEAHIQRLKSLQHFYVVS